MKKILPVLIFILSLACGILICGCATPAHTENEEQYFTVTYSVSAGGAINGTANQSVKEGEDGTEVTAVPNDGYQFVKWSDGLTEVTRQDKNVTSDISVTAQFKKVKFALRYETDGNGTISGKNEQNIKAGDVGETVIAVANYGYEFEKWSDGKVTSERQDTGTNQDKTYTAIFKKVKYTLRYDVNVFGMGKIEGWYDQKVLYGEDAQSVTAVAFNNYIFLKWSDGVTTPTRRDTGISEDLHIIAYFGCRIEYKVNDNVGGKLKGETYQEVMPEQNCSKIEAVADDGYVFSGWSDLSMNPIRRDLSAKKNFEYMAYFEPIERVFKYDYGTNYKTPAASEVKINRNNVQNLKFVIPELSGYKFGGWYADKEYKIKVVNENGLYMLGYNGLTLDANTLYARWEGEEDPEVPVYKILITYVDEVHATLKSSKTNTEIEVDYKMSGFERVLCTAVTDKMQICLNQWFEGKVKFEIDSYFTLIPVGTDSFSSGTSGDNVDYTLYGNDIPELATLNNLYHSVLTAFCMNDYQDLLHFCSGVAGNKYGCIYIEDIISSPKRNNIPLHKFLQKQIDSKVISDDNTSIIGTFLHEFIHTCEMSYGWLENEVVGKGFHDVLTYYIYKLKLKEFDSIKDYLLREAEIDGKECGIPWEFWKHKVTVAVNFVDEPLNLYRVGKIVEINNGTEVPSSELYVSKRIEYGSSLMVKAIPYEGYRFVRWSDGVTTAERCETNIISFLGASAIFEKIV